MFCICKRASNWNLQTLQLQMSAMHRHLSKGEDFVNGPARYNGHISRSRRWSSVPNNDTACRCQFRIHHKKVAYGLSYLRVLSSAFRLLQNPFWSLNDTIQLTRQHDVTVFGQNRSSLSLVTMEQFWMTCDLIFACYRVQRPRKILQVSSHPEDKAPITGDPMVQEQLMTMVRLEMNKQTTKDTVRKFAQEQSEKMKDRNEKVCSKSETLLLLADHAKYMVCTDRPAVISQANELSHTQSHSWYQICPHFFSCFIGIHRVPYLSWPQCLTVSMGLQSTLILRWKSTCDIC